MDPSKLDLIVNTLRDAKLYISKMRELSYLMFTVDNRSSYDYNDDLKEIFKELRNFSIDFASIISLVVDALNFEEIYTDYLKIKNNSTFLRHNLHVLNPDIIDDIPSEDFIPQNKRNTILTIDSTSKIIRSDLQTLKSKFKNFEVNRLITNYETLISSFNLDVYTRKLEVYKSYRDKLLVYSKRINEVLSNYQLTIDKINTVILLLENADHKQVLLNDKRTIETFKLDLEKTNIRFDAYLKRFDLFYNSILYFIEKLTIIRSSNELTIASSNNINKFLKIKSKINTVENDLIQVKSSLSTSDLLENTTFSQIYIDRFNKFRKDLINKYAELKFELDKLILEWFVDFKQQFTLGGFPIPERYKPSCNNIDCILDKYNLNPDLILLKDNFFRDLFYIYNLSNTNNEPDIKIIRSLLNKFNFNMFFSSISYHIESFNAYNVKLVKLISFYPDIFTVKEINLVDRVFKIHYLKIKNKLIDHVSSLYTMIEDFVKIKFSEDLSNDKLLDNPYTISKLNADGGIDGTGSTYHSKGDFCFYILESTSPFGVSNSYLTFLNSEIKFDTKIEINNRIFTFESSYGTENNIIIKIEQLVCGLTKEKFQKFELDISVATSMKNTLFPAKSYINPNFYGFSILIGYGNVVGNKDKSGFFISCENLDRIILNKFEVDSVKFELSIFLNHEYNQTVSTPNSRIETVEKLELTDRYSLYKSQALNAIYEFTYLELASLAFDTKYANLCINDLIGLGITNLNLSNYYYLINNLPQNGAGLTKLYDIEKLEQLIKNVKSNFKSYLKSKLANWIPNDYEYTLVKPEDVTKIIIEDFNKKYIEVLLNKLANEINDYASIIKYEKDYVLENYIESLIFLEFGIDSYDYRKAIYDNTTEINNLKLFFDSELNGFVKDFTSGSGFSIYEKEFYNKITEQYYILYNYGISEFSAWIDLLLANKYVLRGITKKEAMDNLFNKLFKNNIYINFDEFSTLKRNFEDFQTSLKTAIYDSVSIIINIFYMDVGRINNEYTFQCVHYDNLIKKTDDIIELINNLLKSYSNKINNITAGKIKFDIRELLFEKKITELKPEVDNYNLYSLCSLIIPSFEKDWPAVGDINSKKLKELFALCNKFDNIDIRNFKSYIAGLKKSLTKQKIDNFSKLVNLTVKEFKTSYFEEESTNSLSSDIITNQTQEESEVNLIQLVGDYVVESSSETEENFHHKLYVDRDSISSMDVMATIKSKLPLGTTVYFDSNTNVKGSIRTIEDEFIVANIPKFYAACPRLILYGTMDSQIFNDLVKVKASIEGDDSGGSDSYTKLPGFWVYHKAYKPEGSEKEIPSSLMYVAESANDFVDISKKFVPLKDIIYLSMSPPIGVNNGVPGFTVSSFGEISPLKTSIGWTNVFAVTAGAGNADIMNSYAYIKDGTSDCVDVPYTWYVDTYSGDGSLRLMSINTYTDSTIGSVSSLFSEGDKVIFKSNDSYVYLISDFEKIGAGNSDVHRIATWKCSSITNGTTASGSVCKVSGGGDGGGDPSTPDIDDGGDYIDASNKLLKDYTLFDFTLLSTDYINSYQIPKSIPDMIKNSAPNIFSEQRYSPLPLSANPLDSESIYQFCRSPRFDNMMVMMEDTISQPFNSMHMYFNSNKYNIDKFGGIDNSSIGSSHRTKIIINSNTTGSVSPRASDGAGYLSNDVRSGGMHIYTADNFYMTTDREYHNAINGSSYTKFGNSCNVLIGSRKNKPAYNTIPENTYENISNNNPTKLNIESRNETNLLFRENNYLKLTSETPVHFRISSRTISKSRTGSGKVINENFKFADENKDSGKKGSFYLTVTDNIHLVANGGISSSINGIYNSRQFTLKANYGLNIESVNGDINIHNGKSKGKFCPIITISSGRGINLKSSIVKVSGQLNVEDTSHFENNVYINGSLFVNGLIFGVIPACKCGVPGAYLPPKNLQTSCSTTLVENPNIALIAESAEETKGYSEVDPKTKEVSGVGDS